MARLNLKENHDPMIEIVESSTMSEALRDEAIDASQEVCCEGECKCSQECADLIATDGWVIEHREDGIYVVDPSFFQK